MTAPARALVQRHLAAGDLCAVVTATNSFVTGAIAREFGIPHLIGTVLRSTSKTGHFPGRRPACRPSARARSPASTVGWNHWACGGAALASFFYSDSHNDLPLMHKVTTPVAVDPDDKLRAHAEQMGWKIITLR